MPYERFTIRSSADVTTFVLLLVVGVIVSQLAAYARRLKVVAITAPHSPEAACLCRRAYEGRGRQLVVWLATRSMLTVLSSAKAMCAHPPACPTRS